MQIIYVDNHLLVVNKPAGILTQPSGTLQPNLEEQAKSWIKERYQKQSNVFLGVVHRLDKPVSGIVLFARTSKALSRLNELMRQQQTKKFYLAVVEGHLKKNNRPLSYIGQNEENEDDNECTLEHYLIHDDHYALAVKPGDAKYSHYSRHPSAKLARLRYRVIEESTEGDYQTLVEVALETGRYHQIRAQFAAEGHPIVGDAKYGSRQSCIRGQALAQGTIALHHQRLVVVHPTTGEMLTFLCQPPFMNS